MERIFKYKIPIADEFELELPVGARILTFQVQYGEPVIWAIVEPGKEEKVNVRFRLYGTGHPIKHELNSYRYIGTAQMADGQLVWHLFVERNLIESIRKNIF